MSLTVKIKGDASHFDKTIGKTKSSIATLGTAAGAVGVAFVAAGAAITAAAVAAGAFYNKMILVGEAALTSEARLQNIVHQMGLFGESSKEVSDRLSELANTQARTFGIDNKAIRLTQSKLATFKELLATADETGGAFDRATMAAVNMASAGFGQAEQNAVQLGKALNDPIKGITSLTRSGITFTAAEREKIKVMVESNQIGKAQALILNAIEKQVGGTALATADASLRMKESYAQLVQEFAKPFAASITSLPDEIEGMFPKLKQLAADAGLVVSTALQDAFKGNLEGIVNIGVLIGNTLIDGIALAIKVGAPAISNAFRGIIQDRLDQINPFLTDEQRSILQQKGTYDPGKADRTKQLEAGVRAIMGDLQSGISEMQFQAMARQLFSQGYREANPIYQGTEMGEILRQLERMNQTLDKPFPN
jgi:hypothetical protein